MWIIIFLFFLFIICMFEENIVNLYEFISENKKNTILTITIILFIGSIIGGISYYHIKANKKVLQKEEFAESEEEILKLKNKVIRLIENCNSSNLSETNKSIEETLNETRTYTRKIEVNYYDVFRDQLKTIDSINKLDEINSTRSSLIFNEQDTLYSQIDGTFTKELDDFYNIKSDNDLPQNIKNIAIDIEPSVKKEYDNIFQYCKGHKDGYFNVNKFPVNSFTEEDLRTLMINTKDFYKSGYYAGLILGKGRYSEDNVTNETYIQAMKSEIEKLDREDKEQAELEKANRDYVIKRRGFESYRR